MRRLFFFLLFCLFLAFCKNEAPQSAVRNYSRFYIRYIASEKLFRADASFKSGKDYQTAQLITLNGYPKIQDSPMRKIKDASAGYTFDEKTAFLPEYQFNWVDLQGKEQQFKMAISPIDSFGFGSSKIAHNKPAKLSWVGNPIEKQEIMKLFWENDQGETLTMPVSGLTSVSNIEFPALEMSKLKPGKWKLYLVRQKLIKMETPEANNTGEFEFYTKTIDVTVE